MCRIIALLLCSTFLAQGCALKRIEENQVLHIIKPLNEVSNYQKEIINEKLDTIEQTHSSEISPNINDIKDSVNQIANADLPALMGTANQVNNNITISTKKITGEIDTLKKDKEELLDLISVAIGSTNNMQSLILLLLENEIKSEKLLNEIKSDMEKTQKSQLDAYKSVFAKDLANLVSQDTIVSNEITTLEKLKKTSKDQADTLNIETQISTLVERRKNIRKKADEIRSNIDSFAAKISIKIYNANHSGNGDINQAEDMVINKDSSLKNE